MMNEQDKATIRGALVIAKRHYDYGTVRGQESSGAINEVVKVVHKLNALLGGSNDELTMEFMLRDDGRGSKGNNHGDLDLDGEGHPGDLDL